MREDSDAFQWLQQRILKWYRNCTHKTFPDTIILDSVQSFMLAREEIPPDVDHILCLWHAKCAIAAYAEKRFTNGNKADFDDEGDDVEGNQDNVPQQEEELLSRHGEFIADIDNLFGAE